MKLIFLGTCSGTEPMPGRKHTSLVLETAGRLYWFDAGEGCSYTAHLLGLDLLKVQKVVISHPHMDHIGGLCNLIWNIRKLFYVKKRQPDADPLEVYFPEKNSWDGILAVLGSTEVGDTVAEHLCGHEIQDGVLFDDGFVKVTALHNHHLPQRGDKWIAYSFLMECEGKRIVFSADVKHYSDVDALVGQGCDALILETGHHKIQDAYDYTSDKSIGKLFFVHHGRQILNATEECKQLVQELWKGSAAICDDGMIVEL